jgi:hypothetical protein
MIEIPLSTANHLFAPCSPDDGRWTIYRRLSSIVKSGNGFAIACIKVRHRPAGAITRHAGQIEVLAYTNGRQGDGWTMRRQQYIMRHYNSKHWQKMAQDIRTLGCE